MTEHRIFEILLKDFKIEDYEFDYPRLQKTPARFIAQKFTDIIYDTLKQKSSVSNIKRGNTVKFINSLCEVKECHGKDENYDFYFATVKKFYETAEDVDLNKLCCEAYSDLSKYVPDNFTDEVVMFQRKKYSKQMGQVRKLEFVKMMDQEEISAKFDMQVRKKFNYYETNETLIRNALGRGLDFRLKNSSLENESTDFREKQIKKQQCHSRFSSSNVSSSIGEIDF
ncbi:hypothetical protein NQ318_002194 [Aromia moschata]|uniref:Uncharacterized protein n=1 Tax=Aromia moschata TaxID=1265417 RepID=A0AAV8Z4I2_9CUCU|nr:hypothetical protein NQ318_002194 [Aromia moschata]